MRTVILTHRLHESGLTAIRTPLGLLRIGTGASLIANEETIAEMVTGGRGAGVRIVIQGERDCRAETVIYIGDDQLIRDLL